MQFIKASHHHAAKPVFGAEHVRANARNKRLTVLLPDTNILIDMEWATADKNPDNDQVLKEYGLTELVEILKLMEREQIPFSFSPYLSFQEMDKAFTKRALRLYNQFGARFGINWMDDDELQNPDLKVGRERLASWRSLPEGERNFLAVSHATLMLMLLIQRDGAEFSPIGRYKRFLREVEKRVGIVSTPELIIAKYVFADTSEVAPELRKFCSTMGQNFAGQNKGWIPRTVAEMDKTALNAAFDLARITTANAADAKGMDGHAADSWIVTKDDKFARFFEVCHHFDLGLGREFTGAVMAHTPLPQESGYFSEASKAMTDMTDKRAARGWKTPDYAGFPAKAEGVLELAAVGI